jgi:hypothetical protein
MIQALDAAPADGDTLITDYFPDLLENIELMTRLSDVKLKRLVFRKPSRTHGYFSRATPTGDSTCSMPSGSRSTGTTS